MRLERPLYWPFHSIHGLLESIPATIHVAATQKRYHLCPLKDIHETLQHQFLQLSVSSRLRVGTSPLTCMSNAALRPASKTSSCPALPSSMIALSSPASLPWSNCSSPRGTGANTALLVTRLNARTRSPQCLATTISGTVDMPTTSAPIIRSIRLSALVS